MKKGRRNTYLNLNPLAKEFKADLHRVLNTLSNIADWELSGRFTDWLKTEGILRIEPNTVYKYLYRGSLPLEVGIHFLSFLAREPYIKNVGVKNFIQKWVSPVNQAIIRVREAAVKEKEILQAKEKELDRFL